MKLYLTLLFFYGVFAYFQAKADPAIQKREPTKDLCHKITVQHKPSKNTLYKAGIDAEGRKVAPADINAFKVPLAKTLRIPLVIQKKFTLKTESSGTVPSTGTGKFIPEGQLKSPYVDEIPLGFLEYELESGKITYNGKVISSQDEALLRQKCQNILNHSEK